MKNLLTATVTIVFLLLLGSPVFSTTYTDVIKVIDEWLDSIPKDSYKAVEEERSFQLRAAVDTLLKMETSGARREIFIEYDGLREIFW